jgi:hypothetical protein
MTGDTLNRVTTEEPTAELPPREPRSLLVHALIDTAVAFLGCVVVLLILGLQFWVVVIVAVVLGVAVAPATRRAEMRALAKRPTG